MPATVAPGANSETVKFLQQRLVAKGYPVDTDGVFGPKTEDAVLQFQTVNGLKADGIVGPNTWDALLVDRRVGEPASVLGAEKAWLLGQLPANLPAKPQAVMTLAIAQLGLKEIPTGSNGGTEIAHIVNPVSHRPGTPSEYWTYIKAANTKGMPPWCAIFVSWALRDGLAATDWKHTPFKRWYGGVSEIERWAKLNGAWRLTSAVGAAASGAIFTMGRGGSGSDPATTIEVGHTGFVVAEVGDRVITIEGNVGNAVGARNRPKADLRGFVHWW